MQDYFFYYKRALPNSPHSTYTTFYSHKGCKFRNNHRSCIFCAIQHNDYRFRAPKGCWKEIKYLKEKFGINYIMDVGDNLTKEWLRSFLNEKPSDININYSGYMRSDYIDEEVAELLSKIPCHSIFIGVESGDEEVLTKSGKRTTPFDNLKAVELLKKYNIGVRLGVILGLPFENKNSLDKTLDHVEHILKIGKVEGIYSSLMIPLPGSQSFSMLANYNGAKEKMLNSDLFDVDFLINQWTNSFTKVSYNELLKAESYIQSLITPICQ